MSKNANLLVGQSGGPTAVVNCSLAGVIRQAAKCPGVGPVYGMRRGLEGLLARDLVDLTLEAPETVDDLCFTPAAALGTCRRRLAPGDVETALQVLRAYDVGYLLYIGGNDSADTSHRLVLAARDAGYPLNVIGVPKTIDNDLAEMDHTPGYPSIARYVAVSVLEAGLDLEATATVDPVCVLEVMGRNAGWVAAAAALAKGEPDDAPHLIYVPERPLSEAALLGDVQAVYDRLGRVMVVIAETVRDDQGMPWASAPEMDAFDHPRLVGAAERICALIRRRLGLRARWNRPGTLQRASALLASPVDREEALAVGEAAVTAATAGESDQMVTLVRTGDRPYRCETGLAPLSLIANAERRLPGSFLNQQGNFVTAAFLDYVRPLAGELPGHYVRLRGERARPLAR